MTKTIALPCLLSLGFAVCLVALSSMLDSRWCSGGPAEDSAFSQGKSAILTRPRLLDLDRLHRLSDMDCLHCLPFPVCPWTRQQSAGMNDSPLVG